MLLVFHDGGLRDLEQQSLLQLAIHGQIAAQPGQELIRTERPCGDVDRQHQLGLLPEQGHAGFQYGLVKLGAHLELLYGGQELACEIVGPIARDGSKQLRMQARAIIEAAGRLRLEAPQVSGHCILYQITPGQAPHQPLIRAPFHDDGTPSLVARLAQRIVRLGQQGGEVIIAITAGDPDHGERTALTHGIDHQIGDTAIDQLRQILEL
ncbi:hypothetical protein D3C75_618140 [compost metagenome]